MIFVTQMGLTHNDQKCHDMCVIKFKCEVENASMKKSNNKSINKSSLKLHMIGIVFTVRHISKTNRTMVNISLHKNS